MDFAHRLKHFREKKNMTQQQLASSIGVTTVCIGNWERGTRKPTMDMLIALSTSLNISIDSLVGVVTTNVSQPVLSISEMTLLNNYNSLDKYGKIAVDTICRVEKQRIEAERKSSSNVVEFPTPSERFIPHYTSPSAAGFNVPLDGADFEMIEDMNNTIENAIENKADNIIFNPEDSTIQLSANGVPVGDKIVVNTNTGAVVTNAGISSDNELILTFNDGTVKNLGSVMGKDGAVYVPHISERKVLTFTIEDEPGEIPEPVDLNPNDEWSEIEGDEVVSDYIWEPM